MADQLTRVLQNPYDVFSCTPIRVVRHHVLQEFSAEYKPEAAASVPLTAVHKNKPAGHHVFIQWVPVKGGTQPGNF